MFDILDARNNAHLEDVFNPVNNANPFLGIGLEMRKFDLSDHPDATKCIKLSDTNQTL